MESDEFLPLEIYENILNQSNPQTLGRVSQTSKNLYDLSQKRREIEKKRYDKIKDVIQNIRGTGLVFSIRNINLLNDIKGLPKDIDWNQFRPGELILLRIDKLILNDLSKLYLVEVGYRSKFFGSDIDIFDNKIWTHLTYDELYKLLFKWLT